MERSLSVLMPVHNVESTLSQMVLDTLDMVSDHTDQFELVIVDDGSLDATCEVVDELIRSYPQIRSVRHGERQGRDAAIRTGLKHSSGEIILLHEADHEQSRPRYQMLHRPPLERVHEPSRPMRPNYLTRLRQFAWGE